MKRIHLASVASVLAIATALAADPAPRPGMKMMTPEPDVKPKSTN